MKQEAQAPKKTLHAKEILQPALALFVFCLIVTALLAGTNLLTRDQIAEQNRLAEEASRLTVSPGAESFSPSADGTYYLAEAGGETVGYVFTTTASSYGGQIRVMTGISAEGTITGVSLLEISDTPGLGMNAQREEFRAQYEKPAPPDGFTVLKNGTPDNTQIGAMTGATITSQAVTDAVNEAVAQYYAIKEAE